MQARSTLNSGCSFGCGRSDPGGGAISILPWTRRSARRGSRLLSRSATSTSDRCRKGYSRTEKAAAPDPGPCATRSDALGEVLAEPKNASGVDHQLSSVWGDQRLDVDQVRVAGGGFTRPRDGGKRSMSSTFESEPTMFDCPAKMNTRSGWSPPRSVRAIPRHLLSPARRVPSGRPRWDGDASGWLVQSVALGGFLLLVLSLLFRLLLLLFLARRSLDSACLAAGVGGAGLRSERFRNGWSAWSLVARIFCSSSWRRSAGRRRAPCLRSVLEAIRVALDVVELLRHAVVEQREPLGDCGLSLATFCIVR